MLPRLTTFVRRLLGLTGMTEVVLGLAFWTHHGLGLLPLHMAVGMTFVLSLIILAVLGALTGGRGLPLLGSALAIATPLFGMAQVRILPGRGHWAVQGTHLLLGIAGMVVGDRLTRSIRAWRAPVTAAWPGETGTRHAA